MAIEAAAWCKQCAAEDGQSSSFLNRNGEEGAVPLFLPFPGSSKIRPAWPRIAHIVPPRAHVYLVECRFVVSLQSKKLSQSSYFGWRRQDLGGFPKTWAGHDLTSRPRFLGHLGAAQPPPGPGPRCRCPRGLRLAAKKSLVEARAQPGVLSPCNASERL